MGPLVSLLALLSVTPYVSNKISNFSASTRTYSSASVFYCNTCTHSFRPSALRSRCSAARRMDGARLRDVRASYWPRMLILIVLLSDNPGARTLGGDSFTDTVNMTVENCVNFCDSNGFIFAGVEFSQVKYNATSHLCPEPDENIQECYCGDQLLNGATNATSTDCNDACKGDASELCGGSGMSLFSSY